MSEFAVDIRGKLFAIVTHYNQMPLLVQVRHCVKPPPTFVQRGQRATGKLYNGGVFLAIAQSKAIATRGEDIFPPGIRDFCPERNRRGTRDAISRIPSTVYIVTFAPKP